MGKQNESLVLKLNRVCSVYCVT